MEIKGAGLAEISEEKAKEILKILTNEKKEVPKYPKEMLLKAWEDLKEETFKKGDFLRPKEVFFEEGTFHDYPYRFPTKGDIVLVVDILGQKIDETCGFYKDESIVILHQCGKNIVRHCIDPAYFEKVSFEKGDNSQ